MLDAISLLAYLFLGFIIIMGFLIGFAILKAFFTNRDKTGLINAKTVSSQKTENYDPSVYSDNPEATEEDDMEEDLALLDDEDHLW